MLPTSIHKHIHKYINIQNNYCITILFLKFLTYGAIPIGVQNCRPKKFAFWWPGRSFILGSNIHELNPTSTQETKNKCTKWLVAGKGRKSDN